MSTSYQGNPANVSIPINATVTNATNASPIVITTSASHLFSTGDRVYILGVGGNTNANGGWNITVIDATRFSLNGSTGNAAYTSGGNVQNQALQPPFQIPSDGDMPTAASVNVALQMLADRTQYLNQQLTIHQRGGAGVWTPPPNCFSAVLVGYGGGGGGGTPANATTLANTFQSGGSGGGAAVASTQVVSVTPGTQYTITLGAGGASGGGNGGNTTFAITGGATLATFPGAGGGSVVSGTTPGTANGVAGGGPVAHSLISFATTTPTQVTGSFGPGFGGDGWDNQATSLAGWTSPQGFAGGTAGPKGTDSGTSRGGGGGGGGAAGPGGIGGTGGTGGNGSAGTGTNGTAGTAAANGSGAGGGGGGAGGFGATAGGTSGAGGAGGSGSLTILYVASTP